MDQWRITLLGDEGVGKTALAVQHFDPTLEEGYRKQCVVDNQLTFLEIIDTLGQEEHATLRDQWIREGQGFALVYSVTSRASFDHIESFWQRIVDIKSTRPVIFIVGNKSDSAYNRQVSHEEGAALAHRLNCPFLETSAKTAANVDRLFVDLIRTLRDRHAAPHPIQQSGKPIKKRPFGTNCHFI